MKKYFYLIATTIVFFSIAACKKKSADIQPANVVNVVFISYSAVGFFPQKVIVSNSDSALFSNPILNFTIAAPLTPVTVQLPTGNRWVNISGTVLTSAGTLPYNFNQPITVTGNKDTIIIGNVASDFRYKKNIAKTEAKNLLPQFMQLKEYSYQYKASDFPWMHFNSDYTYGFIAQDVEKVMPWLVSKNSEGYRSVNYMGVIPVLTAVVQQQQQQIELLNKDIRELKSMIYSNKKNR